MEERECVVDADAEDYKCRRVAVQQAKGLSIHKKQNKHFIVRVKIAHTT
jgi:hypothetical protein